MTFAKSTLRAAALAALLAGLGGCAYYPSYGYGDGYTYGGGYYSAPVYAPRVVIGGGWGWWGGHDDDDWRGDDGGWRR